MESKSAINQECIKQVAERLFDLFIVNPNVAAIQQPDGKYLTKYFTFNSQVLYKMLLNNGSMGCYQQGYRNGLVKWICLDFDCIDKENPDIQWLFEQAVRPCLEYLESINIHHLVEFSGRRGIHIWIVFNNVMEKKQAYYIIEKLLQQVKYSEEIKSNFSIDRFPATASAYGNKVGKQVKIPLSVHSKGGRSFFFDKNLDLAILDREDFWEYQHKILCSYVENDIEECLRVLGLDIEEREMEWKYRQYQVVEGVKCTAEQIVSVLSETTVYKKIFERLRSGIKESRDWFVLLGTLKYLNDSDDVLNEIFSMSPLYQREMTKEKIRQWKEKYNPATFGYLYDIYHINMEEELDPTMTGFMYLLIKLGVDKQYIEKKIMYQISEQKTFQNAECIRNKEKNYILDNDEVVEISYWNRINYLVGYDLDRIDALVNEIKTGRCKKIDLFEYRVYIRKEKEKERKLVSLGAEERIITTYLATLLAYDIRDSWKSYSYNLMFLSDSDIFYNWYSSWENFIDSIKCYLEVPYLEDYGIMELDLKSFYDSVDYLSIYQILKERLSQEDCYIMECLIDFNDNLMRSINSGYRVGIPQGPAYARIIAEYFLTIVLEDLEIKCPELQKGEYKFSRYVDDMFLVYSEDIDGEIAYNQIKTLLEKYGLHLNAEKSVDHGRIKDINSRKRAEILRFDKFHYEFKECDDNWSLNSIEKYNRFTKTIFAQEFNIDHVSYVFGKMQNQLYQKMYYESFAPNIFKESSGRGSAFIKFYRFVFSNEACLQMAIDKRLFSLIPINTINFKNCISQMYLAVQEEMINLSTLELQEVLVIWQGQAIDTAEKCILQALLER